MAKKKVSIREFVSEEELKFQLYYLKYSGLIKDIEELPSPEIIANFNTKIAKRIKLITKKIKNAEKDKEYEVAEILSINKKYIESLTPYIDAEKTKEEFEGHRKEFLEYLNSKLSGQNPQKKYRDMYDYASVLQISSAPSKTKFGVMLLLMIKNIATMPSYSGYTENWKTDFYSNAVEKVLLYLHNFDENLLSKRTGQKSKAFAYITQICTNAFLNIINERKKEVLFLSDTISFESSNVDGVRSIISQNGLESSYEEKEDGVYRILLEKEKDNLEDVLSSNLKYCIKSNKVFSENKEIEYEIEHSYDVATKEEQKTQDFKDYVNELSAKIKKGYEDYKVKKIEISGFDIEKQDANLFVGKFYTSDIEILLSGLETKAKVVHKNDEKIEEFYEEW